jgi:hypothetical protein
VLWTRHHSFRGSGICTGESSTCVTRPHELIQTRFQKEHHVILLQARTPKVAFLFTRRGDSFASLRLPIQHQSIIAELMVAPYPFGCLRGRCSYRYISRFPFWFLLELPKASAFGGNWHFPLTIALLFWGGDLPFASHYRRRSRAGAASRQDAGPRHAFDAAKRQ